MSMTKKILVLLDDIYGYMHYGMILPLSKLDDYEFYGFLSNSKDIEFFEHQSKIKFSELHYYPKYYIENSSPPDLNYLKEIELKYGLDLWKIAYAERTFLQERNFFHNFSSDEILSIIESLSKFYIEFLSRVKPDFIIMQKTGENLANFLLYNISKAMGIKTFMLVETRLLNSFVFSDDLLFSKLKDEFLKIKENPPDDIPKYDLDYLHKKQTNVVKSFGSVKFGYATNNQKLKRYSKRTFVDPEPIFYNRGKTKWKMLSWRWKSFFEIRKRKNFIDSNAHRTIPAQKFVYFPLPVQPEAWSNAWAPFHTNLVSIIENLAKSVPSEYLLLVKEHPGQKGKLWRELDFYKKILALPNVRLIHPEMDNYELISKCDLVSLINSSGGLEALFYKKPVIVFSDVYYDVVKMVTKIKNIVDLPSEIRKSLYSFEFDSKEFSYLIMAIENSQIVVPYYDIMKDGIVLYSFRNHSNLSEFIPEVELFLTKFEKDFQTLANRYHELFCL